MATVRHSLIYELRGDEKDLIQDLKKVSTAFDKLQANFKEGLRAPATVGAAGAAGAAGMAGAGATGAAGAAAAGTAAAVAAKKVGMLGTAMAGIKALAPALGLAMGAHQVIRFGRAVEASTTQMEVWRRHFQIMGDTAAEANRDLEKTIDFASATILDTGEVVKARLALRQLGVTGYRELRAIADAAQITGISITSLSDSLGRLRSGGPLQMAMRPLTKFGISTEDFVKRAEALQAGGMTESGARTQAFTESLEAGFGGATKSMESTVESLKGTLSNEWMMTMAGLGDEFRPAQQALLEAGIGIAKAAADLAPIGKLAAYITHGVLAPFQGFGELRKDLAGLADRIMGNTNKVINDVTRMGEEAPTGFEAMGPVLPNFWEGMGLRSKEMFTQMAAGLPVTPRGLNLPPPPEPYRPQPGAGAWYQQQSHQAYQAARQAQTVNNITNFTQYSPVGIAPQSNLAGLAP